jgi:hypothetical protein
MRRWLRFLFLVALFSVLAFLLHLSKRLCHVFELIPNIKTYVDNQTQVFRVLEICLGRSKRVM